MSHDKREGHEASPGGNIFVYQSDGGQVRVDVRLQDETV